VVLAGGLMFGATACTLREEANPEPSPTVTDELYEPEDGARSAVETFFVLVSVADVENVLEYTDLNAAGGLLDSSVYLAAAQRPEIIRIDDIVVADDEETATATVTYRMGEQELTAEVATKRVAVNDRGPDDHVVLIPRD